MSFGLSPQNERYLDERVALGHFPSKAAALDAAVDALRSNIDEAPPIPVEHLSAVEQALTSSAAGRSKPMTTDDWERLRKLAREAGADRNIG